jgi:serine/threonine protein kinase
MQEEEDNPSTIGPYDILNILGHGAFATVYRARHRQTHCLVALKSISKRNLRNLMEFDLLDREINVMKSMDHPFITTFFEQLDDADNFYLAMELVETGNLLDYINISNGLREAEVRRIFFQIMTVLDYLHREKQVVHRDLKPENILLDFRQNIRVADFGMSKAFSKDNPWLRTACGTPNYVAPEIIHQHTYTAAADIWSAGVLLYAMATGRLPFDDENITTTMQKIISAEPEFPPEVSIELRDLLRRMLTKDPDLRITIPGIMKHLWMLEYSGNRGAAADLSDLANLKVHDVLGLDLDVITQMKGFGIETNGILAELRSAKTNERTAIYKMLRKEMLVEEIDAWQRSKARRSGERERRESMVQQKLPILCIQPRQPKPAVKPKPELAIPKWRIRPLDQKPRLAATGRPHA